MPTLKTIITEKLARFSIEITPAELEREFIDAGINPTAGVDKEYDASDSKPVNTVLYNIVTDLLAMPDVTEGGMSLKWDRASVKAYAGLLQTKLGGIASGTPTVTDRSYLW